MRLLILTSLFIPISVYSIGQWGTTVRTVVYCESVDSIKTNPQWYQKFEHQLVNPENVLRLTTYSADGQAARDDSSTINDVREHNNVNFIRMFAPDGFTLCREYDLTSRRP